MSDVGLNFSVLDVFVVGAIIALPLTTILLVVLVLRRLVARRRPTRSGLRSALNAGIIVTGPFWAIGIGALMWLWIGDILEGMRVARRHFTLTAERTIGGHRVALGVRGYARRLREVVRRQAPRRCDDRA